MSGKSEDHDHHSTANSGSWPSKFRKRSPTQKLTNTLSTPLVQQPNEHAFPSKGPAKNVDPSNVATEPDNKEDELSKETDKSNKSTHVGAPAIMKSLVRGLGLQRALSHKSAGPCSSSTTKNGSRQSTRTDQQSSSIDQSLVTPIEPGVDSHSQGAGPSSKEDEVCATSPVVISSPNQVQPSEDEKSESAPPKQSTQQVCRPDGGNGGSDRRDTLNVEDEPTDELSGGYNEVNILDELAHDEVIIAIMGPTGSGKSSFISKVTGNVGGVGHDLTSYTSEIKVTKCGDMGFGNIVLVDTPGFDDTTRSDLEILELISNWLKETYGKVFLSGILYFHRITDNRMAGTPLKNLQVFQKLCGEDAMAQVVLVTTMWDEMEDGVGDERLKELKSTYWKGMISCGSETFEYRNNPQSAEELLKRIADKSSERRHVLLQQEISEWKKELRETEAGQVLHSRLEQLADQRLQALKRLRAEQSKFTDARTTEELRKEYADLKAQLDETLKEVHALRLPRKKSAITHLFEVFKVLTPSQIFSRTSFQFNTSASAK